MNVSHPFPNASEQNQDWPVGIITVLLGLDVLSIIGNVIIVIMVCWGNKLKTLVGKLTVNQAVADGAVSVVWFGVTVYHLVFKPDQSRRFIVYTAVRVCLTVLYSESFQTLAGTAFSLCMAICHPVKFRMYSQTWMAAVFIVSTWLLNISVGCLIFTTDNSIVHDDMMLFSFYRLQPNAIWYAVLKMMVMFLPPLMTFICYIQIWIHKRAIRNDELQAQSDTLRLISQAQGILLFLIVYGLAFVLQIVNDNIHPLSIEYDTIHTSSVIISFVVYQYLVMKLPLFLLAFKSYRKVAKDMFCPCRSRNRVHPVPTDNSSNQRKHRSHELDESTNATVSNPKMLHPKWSPSRKDDREEQASVSANSFTDANTTGNVTLHGGKTVLSLVKEAPDHVKQDIQSQSQDMTTSVGINTKDDVVTHPKMTCPEDMIEGSPSQGPLKGAFPTLDPYSDEVSSGNEGKQTRSERTQPGKMVTSIEITSTTHHTNSGTRSITTATSFVNINNCSSVTGISSKDHDTQSHTDDITDEGENCSSAKRGKNFQETMCSDDSSIGTSDADCYCSGDKDEVPGTYNSCTRDVDEMSGTVVNGTSGVNKMPGTGGNCTSDVDEMPGTDGNCTSDVDEMRA